MTVAVVVPAAQGADLGSPRIPVIAEPASTSAPFSWTGLYAGATLGYAWHKDHLTELATATGGPTGLVYDYKPKGWTGGAKIGANYQMGMLVAGLEADLERSAISAGFTDAPIGAGRDDIRWQSSVRGRLGVAFDRLMLYGTAGAAWAKVENTYTFLPTATQEHVSKVWQGWTVGGGMDYAVTNNWILGIDYRHTDFGKVYNRSTIAFPGLTGEHEMTQNVTRVSLSYKF